MARCCFSCSWWAVSFTTSVNVVDVDPRILPMNNVSAATLQLTLGPTFRVLDVDPAPRSFVDITHGFFLTFTRLPSYSEMRFITDAIVAVYRSGNVSRVFY